MATVTIQTVQKWPVWHGPEGDMWASNLICRSIKQPSVQVALQILLQFF